MRRCDDDAAQKDEIDAFSSPRDRLSCCLLEGDDDATVEAQLLVFLLLCIRKFSLSDEEAAMVEKIKRKLQRRHPNVYGYLSEPEAKCE
jgi:hypothetical protein